MSLKLGTTAPDFTQKSTEGDISFHQWAGDSWVVFFSHPADFTPVCTTELGAVARQHCEHFAAIEAAIEGYATEVRSRAFPGPENVYDMKKG